MIKLFEIENSEVKPTEHCYTIDVLKRIMDEYPEEYLSIYAYLFYKSCLNEELNPFANIPEDEKDDFILTQVGGTFSTDDELIDEALKFCIKMYETPSYTAYMAIKIYMEKLSEYMKTSPITDGRDGNVMAGLKIAERFDAIRQSYKGTYRDFKEEQSTTSRGGNQIAYDQN